jgi:DNA-directed RNA polymerase subunit RPC12/RpoP
MKTVIFKLPDEVLTTIVQKVVWKPEEASLLEKWIYEGEELKKGRWKQYEDEDYVECPFCGHLTNCECKEEVWRLHYCFHCGAEMEGAEE